MNTPSRSEQTYAPPAFYTVPDALLRRGNGNALTQWCQQNGIRPTLAHIENERRQRGITTKASR